ncbi:4-hydroxy-3-methylbut-2-enyl diphosphate reductase [Carboxylicivirga sp. N1Y90]|uniref:4-hydroxy-3-methylbut-2-enyl diphosphate reductase n=1 Tax=Carboxylicivirga fragile TaxID=3417571 RepID=UPI003D354B6F|nr:4-hydroxy-3-methylbut-2-enyl diphosphate reductase [Marinilabiliaceae bacterium N1Y90]
MIKVEIDKYSGFCFGVKKAINAATDLLQNGAPLYCVGDIVHNEAESERLRNLGMKVISHDQLSDINGTILFRAHGEPPLTYSKVIEAGLKLEDQTCPVVLKLQQRIKQAYQQMLKVNGQLLIFGKIGHAEVNGLVGQTDDQAIVIESINDLSKIDFSRPIELFAQTTKNPDELKLIIKEIELHSKASFGWHNTTCKQVTGRVPRIKEFAHLHSVIVFVGGIKSSNAKVLFHACKESNVQSHFVSSPDEINKEWFNDAVRSVGVCGATSTPMWLMVDVAEAIQKLV